MLESLVRGKVGRSLIFGSLLSLLSPSCSRKPNQPEPITPKDSVTVTVDASKDNSVKIGDYSVFIPEKSLSENATVTLKKDSLDIPDSLSSASTGALNFSIDKPLTDTIYFNFPKISDIPSGLSIVRDNLDSSYRIAKGIIGDSDVVVPFFEGSSLTRKIIPINSDVTLNFNFDAKDFYQSVEFQGDVASMVLSNEPIAVLVHGLGSSPKTFQTRNIDGKYFYHEIENFYDGRVLYFQYPSGKNVSENADSLFNRLNQGIFSVNPNVPIDLIGHSMGGVLSRSLIQKHPEHIRNLVTLGSPHDGVSNEEWLRMQLKLKGNDGVTDFLAYLSGIFTLGAQDLYKHSDLLNNLNNFNNSIPARYLTIAGKKWGILSEIIPGDDDGLIEVASADMLDPLFYPTREKPSKLEDLLVDLSHSGLTNGNDAEFQKIRDFVATKIDSTIQLTYMTSNHAIWSPAGDKIVFVVAYYADGGDIWVMNDGGTNQGKLFTSVPSSFDVSKEGTVDGNFVAFSKGFYWNSQTRNQNDILMGGGVAGNAWYSQFYRGLPTNEINPKFFPANGVDLPKLAFLSDEAGNWDVLSVVYGWSGLVRLTNTPLNETSISISPDGNKIITGYNETPPSLYLINSDGSNRTLLTAGENPVWHPNGNLIAYNCDGEIYTINPNGANKSKLTSSLASSRQPIFSYDGSKIAYVCAVSNNDEIFLMNSDGSSQINIMNNPAKDHQPTWSPDGSWIAFTSDRAGQDNIYKVKIF
ncbi:MAG: alpha/beta fold hydrolase [Nanoarchaeota archaeon]